MSGLRPPPRRYGAFRRGFFFAAGGFSAAVFGTMPRCFSKRRRRSIALPPSPAGESSPGLLLGGFIGVFRLRAGEFKSIEATWAEAWDACADR
jgi:hypothetical protein